MLRAAFMLSSKKTVSPPAGQERKQKSLTTTESPSVVSPSGMGDKSPAGKSLPQALHSFLGVIQNVATDGFKVGLVIIKRPVRGAFFIHVSSTDHCRRQIMISLEFFFFFEYMHYLFTLFEQCATGTGQARVANQPSVLLYSVIHTQYEIFQVYKLIFSNKYKY